MIWQKIFSEICKLYLFFLAEYRPPAVVPIILADTGKEGHIFVGDGEVQLDIGLDMVRVGRFGQGNRSQLQRVLDAELGDGYAIAFGHGGDIGIMQGLCGVNVFLAKVDGCLDGGCGLVVGNQPGAQSQFGNLYTI